MRMHATRLRRWIGALLGLAALGVVGVGASPAPAAAAGTVPAFNHIFTIVMENHSYGQIIGSGSAPYINSLAAKYGLATNYFAVAHPSLPNYLALTGGSTFGITSDCTTCFVSAPNIAKDRVDASGRSWKAYMESMPRPCFLNSPAFTTQNSLVTITWDEDNAS